MDRIGIVVNSRSGGGAERSMNILARELVKNGHNVNLVAINDSLPDLIDPKCEVLEIKRNRKSGILSLLRSIRLLNSFVKTFEPNILLINCELPELLTCFVKFNKRLVVIEHASKPWRNRRKLGFIVRLLLKIRGSIFITVSKSIIAWPFFVNFDSTIENAIFVNEKTFSHPNKSKIQRLVFIGRLSAEKNPRMFIEICKLTNLPGLFIGSGDEESNLREFVGGDKIDFLGYQQDPYNFVKNSDLILFTSDSEGDGLVVVEALSHNLPVLLRETVDFLKFDLPVKHYCNSLNDFSRVIVENIQNLENLVIPQNLSQKITSSRNPKVIYEKWKFFLDTK